MPFHIRSLAASNFRSFSELNVDLESFNVLVGPNASGKSNVVEAIRFLRDIARHGLDSAISMQGGAEYLCNRRIGLAKPVTFTVSAVWPIMMLGKSSRGHSAVLGYTYSFSLLLSGGRPQVLSDELRLATMVAPRGAEDLMNAPHVDGEIVLRRSDKKRGTYRVSTTGTLPPWDELGATWLGESTSFKLDGILLGSSLPMLFFDPSAPTDKATRGPLPGATQWRESLADVALYDFDPKLSKRSVPVTGPQELESDGSNLAIALQRVITVKKDRTRFTSLLAETLPFVDALTIRRHSDRSLIFEASETGGSDSVFPSPLLSDGTVNVVAILIALYFEGHAPTVLEEPERSLHPGLIRKAVALLQDASTVRQVLVTTHSPELVKYAGVEPLLLVSRDDDGFSVVRKPSDSAAVQEFLETDIGLDRVFAGGLLDA